MALVLSIPGCIPDCTTSPKTIIIIMLTENVKESSLR